MAFALRKSPTEKSPSVKKSPLGWLGRKSADDDDDGVPQMDIAGGLNRALRGATRPVDNSNDADREQIVREALSAIEAALFTIDRIRDVLEQACEVALSAKDVEEAAGRAMLAERYDELRLSINDIIEEADQRAVILLSKAHRHIDVKLGDKARYSVSPMRLDVSDRGLNLSPPREAFASFEEIDRVLDDLDTALAKADRGAANYCRDAQYLIARMKGDTPDQ